MQTWPYPIVRYWKIKGMLGKSQVGSNTPVTCRVIAQVVYDKKQSTGFFSFSVLMKTNNIVLSRFSECQLSIYAKTIISFSICLFVYSLNAKFLYTWGKKHNIVCHLPISLFSGPGGEEINILVVIFPSTWIEQFQHLTNRMNKMVKEEGR